MNKLRVQTPTSDHQMILNDPTLKFGSSFPMNTVKLSDNWSDIARKLKSVWE